MKLRERRESRDETVTDEIPILDPGDEPAVYARPAREALDRRAAYLDELPERIAQAEAAYQAALADDDLDRAAQARASGTTLTDLLDRGVADADRQAASVEASNIARAQMIERILAHLRVARDPELAVALATVAEYAAPLAATAADIRVTDHAGWAELMAGYALEAPTITAKVASVVDQLRSELAGLRETLTIERDA
jgi:hypothetical protein